jgi:hypothetical protein
MKMYNGFKLIKYTHVNKTLLLCLILASHTKPYLESVKNGVVKRVEVCFLYRNMYIHIYAKTT